MLLKALDARMYTSKTEQVVLPENLTVEHLLPQNGSVSDYPYALLPADKMGDGPDERRKKAAPYLG